jgi:hypothetical protein
MNDPSTLPSVQTEDVRRTVLADPNRRTGLTIATANETVIVDPVTGSRSFAATTALTLTIDGTVVVDPTMLCACEVCGQAPFSTEAVMRCTCGRIACKLTCLVRDEYGPVCRRCATQPWWRRLWNWLTTIH